MEALEVWGNWRCFGTQVGYILMTLEVLVEQKRPMEGVLTATLVDESAIVRA